jgi:hypothetical protein
MGSLFKIVFGEISEGSLNEPNGPNKVMLNDANNDVGVENDDDNAICDERNVGNAIIDDSFISDGKNDFVKKCDYTEYVGYAFYDDYDDVGLY